MQTTAVGQPPKKLRLQKAGSAATAAAVNAQAPAVIQVPKRKRLLKRRLPAPLPGPAPEPLGSSAPDAAPSSTPTAEAAVQPSAPVSTPAAPGPGDSASTPAAQKPGPALPKCASRLLEAELLASAAQPALPKPASKTPPAGGKLGRQSVPLVPKDLAALREKALASIKQAVSKHAATADKAKAAADKARQIGQAAAAKPKSLAADRAKLATPAGERPRRAVAWLQVQPRARALKAGWRVQEARALGTGPGYTQLPAL